MHEPEYLKNPNSKRLILFIHGFMGTPGIFRDLMQAVYEHGFSAASVLLPGHGTTGIEFAKVRVSDWENHIKAELSKYGRYEQIDVVGHSIGGLLALLASLDTNFKIGKAVLLFTPLKVYLLNPFALLIRFRTHIGPKDSGVIKAYSDMNSVSAVFPACLLWLNVLLQPHKLIRKVKKRLGEITIPTLIIHSRNDETASFKSSKLFDKALVRSRRKIITLRDSYHTYFTHGDRKRIQEAVLDFLGN
jgi:carboxylesterase